MLNVIRDSSGILSSMVVVNCSGRFTHPSTIWMHYECNEAHLITLGIILSVECEGGADLVGRAGGGNVVQALSIQSKTERGFHAWPESLRVTCVAREL